jgi:hypothetical protein
MKTTGLLGSLRRMYANHKAARVLTKGAGLAALADPAQAALDALAGTQTVATAQAEPVKPFGAAELATGQASTTLDTKLFVPLPGGITLFNRNRVTGSHKTGTPSSFHFLQGTYKLGGGVSLVAEVDAALGQNPDGSPKRTLDPRSGIHYLGKFGDVTIVGIATAGMDCLYNDDTHLPNGIVITNVTYSPDMADGWKLAAGAETVTSFADELRFATQRLRLGVDSGEYVDQGEGKKPKWVSDYQVGLAADLVEAGPDLDLGVNSGVAVRKVF